MYFFMNLAFKACSFLEISYLGLRQNCTSCQFSHQKEKTGNFCFVILFCLLELLLFFHLGFLLVYFVCMIFFFENWEVGDNEYRYESDYNYYWVRDECNIYCICLHKNNLWEAPQGWIATHVRDWIKDWPWTGIILLL